MKTPFVLSALLAMLAASPVTAATTVAEDSPNVSIGTLFIEGAFTRPTKPGAKTAEGYISIINAGAAPDRLVSVVSDISNKADLYAPETRHGATDMRKLSDGIEIPAGATVNLRPGSDSIVFSDIKHPVKPGSIIHATLGFENAGQIDIGFHAEPSLDAMAPVNSKTKKQ